MLPAILCFADSREHAEQIVGRLQADNVPPADISVLAQPPSDSQPSPIEGLGQDDTALGGTDKKAKAGTAAGGVSGAAAGVATLGVAGMTPLFVLAPVMAGVGAVVGAVVGAAATAADGGLSSYGIAPSRIGYYEQKLLQGAYLVAVRTEDEAELNRAKNVFEQAGGQEVEVFRLTKKLT